ncbi:MAG: transglutaminase domain-containing protein [Planctomycetes bacterium]|nr:transglutaminase domain-containing protein [Planctomycetota bacterium]
MLGKFLILVPMLILTVTAGAQDGDRDGDGLSDFQEIHKYLTDPDDPDSDDDGIPDGDWLERREYQYVVRSVVQVMRPVTPEFLCDDYQDVRVLDQTPGWYELEVVHYPFNDLDTCIEGDPDWRRRTKDLATWTAAGPTADWDRPMQEEIAAALAANGLDLAGCDDRALCLAASNWLLRRARSSSGFMTYFTAYDRRGQAWIPDELRPAALRNLPVAGRSLETQIEHELSARGMFARRERGSCTSTAIYLSGGLRALGLPTRIILCIPLVDGSDPAEHELIERGISHHRLRRHLLRRARAGRESWTAHTFNEVFVGGRWRRLDQGYLGQDLVHAGALGLATKVAMVGDWAEARAWESTGRRQALRRRDDVFGHANPYSCISLRDEFGPHCRLENPEIESMTISALLETDSPALPADVRAGLEPRGRRGLVIVAGTAWDLEGAQAFTTAADRRLDLVPDRGPRIGLDLDPFCFWLRPSGTIYVYLPTADPDRQALRQARGWRLVPRNDSERARWAVAEDLRLPGD